MSDFAARPGRNIPEGVDAQSWIGFEQRIQDRRFNALLRHTRHAIGSRDFVAARQLLDEARQLRPNALELAELEFELFGNAAIPVTNSAGGWRAATALAVFIIGVSALLGIDTVRVPPVGPLPVVSSAPDILAATAFPATQMPEAITSVPAVSAMTEAITSVPPASAITSEVASLARGREATRALAPTTRAAEPTSRVAEALRPPVTRAPESAAREIPRAPISAAPIAPAPVGLASSIPAPSTAAAPTNSVASNVPVVEVAAPKPQAPPANTVTRAAAAVTPAAVPDESRVAEVLRRYARAYGELNASAAREVWPTVNERALSRAFESLASQNLSFEDCQIHVTGATADASCRGEASYVGKVGSGAPRTEPRTWRFELRRDGETWKIQNAEARRLGSASSH